MDALVFFLLILEACLGLFLLYRDGLLKKAWVTVLCAVLIALALSLRASVFEIRTGDYADFLSRWVAYYRANGGFQAFGTLPPYCNYQVPYLYFLALFSYLPTQDLYLIKLLSVLFDLLLAWAGSKLLGRVTRNAGLRIGCFFALLFWPTVFLNGALWGQCDSIYVAFALLGIWLALEDRPLLSMAMMALSFAFKLQAVFVLPICAVLWIYGKYNWKHLFIFPLVYALVLLPAVLLGRPLVDTLLFYFRQTDSIGGGLNYNSPSIFAILWRIPAESPQAQSAANLGIAGAALYMLAVLTVSFLQRRRLSDKSVIALALLLSIGIPFLLPHMHERYFFPADVLAVVLAFAIPSLFLAAPLVCFASLLGYYAYLSFYLSPIGGHYLLYMSYGSYALLGALALTILGYLLSLRSGYSARGKRAKS